MDYGSAILKLRNKTGQKQYEFAESVGITVSYLCLIEKNKKPPSKKVIERIAEHTGTSVAVIMFQSITEDDVAENKREAFRQLRSPIMELIESLNEDK